jgi:hypothetical protein
MFADEKFEVVVFKGPRGQIVALAEGKWGHDPTAEELEKVTRQLHSPGIFDACEKIIWDYDHGGDERYMDESIHEARILLAKARGE